MKKAFNKLKMLWKGLSLKNAHAALINEKSKVIVTALCLFQTPCSGYSHAFFPIYCTIAFPIIPNCACYIWILDVWSWSSVQVLEMSSFKKKKEDSFDKLNLESAALYDLWGREEKNRKLMSELLGFQWYETELWIIWEEKKHVSYFIINPKV